MVQAKEYLIQYICDLIGIKENHRILDLGSGQSKNFLPLLQKYPEMHYVGIEPHKKSSAIAKELLGKYKNAKVYNQLGYEKTEEGPFDLSISLSVLEHVKDIELFIKNSVNWVKTNGFVVHSYDLGHALYPSSLKEKLQIQLCKYLPGLLPESKIARYIDQDRICKMLVNNGVEIKNILYHQMPNHKRFLKHFPSETTETADLAKQLIQWEISVSPHLKNVPKEIREMLFPSIMIIGQKVL